MKLSLNVVCAFSVAGLFLSTALQISKENPLQYIDVATQSGLTAANVFGGVDRKRYLLETTGCGLAWIDYDRDGYADLFLVNGRRFDGPKDSSAPVSHLFRNQGNGTFADVTREAGVGYSGWGQGVCVADYDNDGYDDLFVTYYGKNRLYHTSVPTLF